MNTVDAPSEPPASSDASSPFLKRLAAHVQMDGAAVQEIESLQGSRITFSPGSEIIYQGESGYSAYILRRGWTCSYKRMTDGSRQIIDVQIPGDAVGLRTLLLSTSDQTFETLTEVEVCRFRAERLPVLFARAPRIGWALLSAVTRDEAMLAERLVSLGRRDAIRRTAHFLLELWTRTTLVLEGTPEGFKCPLSQGILAEVLGITSIHLNRVLRQMREANLLTFRDGVVRIFDHKRLIDISGFDFSYLNYATPPWDVALARGRASADRS